MKHLILFFLIILGFILIKCISKFKYLNMLSEYIHPNAIIKTSTINNGGRGVFATRDYKKGEIIEICPCVKTESDELNGRFRDYIFGLNETMSVVALGYCAIYNHSDTPNSSYEVINEYKMNITALQDIKAGEEIFVSYGDKYWESRADTLKKN